MLDVMTIAASSAVLALFFNDIIAEGMIFEWYGKWVNSGAKWKKAIGGCIFCTAFWLTIGMYVMYYDAPLIWSVLTTVGMAHLILRVLDKIEMI